jgi:hypothetical protein
MGRNRTDRALMYCKDDMTTADWLLKLVRTATLSSAVLLSTFAQTAKADDSRRNEEAAMKYLGPYAFYTHTPVRVYVLANCTDSAMQFPRVSTKEPSKGAAGLAAVREMFEEDQNVQVTEDNGIIRVRIGKVPTDLLRTRLAHVSFDREARYDPYRALGAIVGTNEVQTAVQSLGLTAPWRLGGTVVVPEKDFYRLPGSISNVTVEQTLDTIAKTWEGQIVVIYFVCKQPKDSGERLFDFGTYGQIGPRSSSKDAAKVYYPSAPVKKPGK